jgi:tRNA U34 5-methylaminomethyl-2-thiouridine-forming methyltransferase MnmC
MIELISTGDGSSSLYNPELNETYHSRHGALRESRHVFIQEGLELKHQLPKVKILEVGMGTGLNVLLTGLYALQRKQPIHLITLEPFPISHELIAQVNYADLLDQTTASEMFDMIHESSWNHDVQLNDFFAFKKLNIKLEEYTNKQVFDLIYYDAFGPHAQPELWKESVFQHLANFCTKGTTLSTYCAQGQFKRNLKAAGFKIERLPGPPGKREMTRGTFEK